MIRNLDSQFQSFINLTEALIYSLASVSQQKEEKNITDTLLLLCFSQEFLVISLTTTSGI